MNTSGVKSFNYYSGVILKLKTGSIISAKIFLEEDFLKLF
jgi:hypothetical protein